MKNKKHTNTISFPSEKELAEVRKKLSRGTASRPLNKNATQAERLKHSICREFVVYANAHQLTNREMGKKLGIAESLTSKILHYHFDEFTVDRLLGYLSKLYENVEITLKVVGGD